MNSVSKKRFLISIRNNSTPKFFKEVVNRKNISVKINKKHNTDFILKQKL